ncbi:DUF309 domain-containing protein [Salipaludibacillus agaradhaerens]|uniref:DUF309 domain-containing protein n=1 Tax=Salipaludibacillus agaradhaerens TaxID=76935 RepID=UPI0021514798|nr:DUF309 domain-containing protein [Salipaludibacillus agaradhaerens]MCR6106514.1 DUF309 domain-containing protein [Salipaludibacillus agaradhaerens]MCR6118547.1 DUF309 domain-containing protein [Salipaludibacillus agaradhaerens]UJW57641.1 DUF309 domain-containing protein [Bacillus sp. A116_S68]
MTVYPKEYIEYLIHFHGSRDYFECHEIMEEYWLENNRDVTWLALIQLAVAVYHERQQNLSGSLRLYRKVLTHMRANKDIFHGLHIHHSDTEQLIKSRIKTILHEGTYEPFNLPLSDSDLITQCKQLCHTYGWEWLSDDRVQAKDLIYKHKLRDRSDVIQARQHSLLKKKRERGWDKTQ